MTRPAHEIEADDAMAPPPVTAPASAWDAWCERLAPGEYTDASLFRWLEGVALASSGLQVPESISSDIRLSGPARVVYAALVAAALPGDVDPVPSATARIFGHEDSELQTIVRFALAELEALGVVSRTTAGGVAL